MGYITILREGGQWLTMQATVVEGLKQDVTEQPVFEISKQGLDELVDYLLMHCNKAKQLYIYRNSTITSEKISHVNEHDIVVYIDYEVLCDRIFMQFVSEKASKTRRNEIMADAVGKLKAMFGKVKYKAQFDSELIEKKDMVKVVRADCPTYILGERGHIINYYMLPFNEDVPCSGKTIAVCNYRIVNPDVFAWSKATSLSRSFVCERGLAELFCVNRTVVGKVDNAGRLVRFDASHDM